MGELFKKEKILAVFLDSFSSYMLYIPRETMNMQILLFIQQSGGFNSHKTFNEWLPGIVSLGINESLF